MAKRSHRVWLIGLVLCTAGIALHAHHVHASAYTLSYPSYMPGHALYTPRVIWEEIMQWWHFGDIAQTKYHLRLSDRYLVESKTLFEYNQFLLASKALEKSNNHFITAYLWARGVSAKEKDQGEVKRMLLSASEKHEEILTVLKDSYPEDIIWEAESKDPVTLPIPFLMTQSIIIRSYAQSI